tara:strand:+ start:305 stop:508 length:204 start_codon:yes stop_codon:yes gene_type:complete
MIQMNDANDGQPSAKATEKVAGKEKKMPSGEPQVGAWLKHVYDSVVEEPLPDELKNLLARLDDSDSE